MTLITLALKTKRKYKNKSSILYLNRSNLFYGNILFFSIISLIVLFSFSIYYIFTVNNFNIEKARFYKLEQEYKNLELFVNNDSKFLYNSDYFDNLEKKAKEFGFESLGNIVYIKNNDFVFTQNAH